MQLKENGTWRLMLCYHDHQGTIHFGYYKYAWDYEGGDDVINDGEWTSINEIPFNYYLAEITNTPNQYLERIGLYNQPLPKLDKN